MPAGSYAAALALATAAALAPAGAAASPPNELGLTVWPARAVVAAGRPQVIHLRNGSGRAVVVDASVAGFALDLRGTPRVVRTGADRRWLAVRPRAVHLAPGASATVTAWPIPPPHARPGDHPELVLLRTRPLAHGSIGVLVRVGVVLDVRVPGKAARRLEVRGLRVVRTGRGARVVLTVANTGDVTTSFGAATPLQLYSQRGRLLARLRPRGRELLPHSRGLVEFDYVGRPLGRVRALLVALGAGRKVFDVRV
ncbi:MAG TPA: hypothetical protein VFB35_09125 [Gaiellaceae bacterium]|nr:hypothetical protein [Gaiellaceae bacterium]